MTEKIFPIRFPADEGQHQCNIEWWYYNGLLNGENGEKFAYMNCLFKADNKKVKIPYLGRLPLKTVYFFHSILTDLNSKKSYPSANTLAVVSRDSFSKPLFFVNFINYSKPVILGGYLNCVLEETAPFKYHLKNENLELRLAARKRPLLEAGAGYVKLHSKSTYYYSLTNLQTEGVVRLGGKEIPVTGKSWFDHQWANASYTKDTWTWFSVQLEDNTELVCFEYDDGEVKDRLLTISYPDNRQESFKSVEFIPLKKEWTSPKTKAKYQLGWRIRLPEQGIDLTVAPLNKNQEVVFGAINYWEGPLSVVGTVRGKPARGQGFLELVGRQSFYGRLAALKDFLKI